MKDFAVQNLLLYYDTADQWTSAYQPGKVCWLAESIWSWIENVTNLLKLQHILNSQTKNYYSLQ